MVTVTHTATDTQDEGSRLTGEQPSRRGGRPEESLLASLCTHSIFMGCLTCPQEHKSSWTRGLGSRGSGPSPLTLELLDPDPGRMLSDRPGASFQVSC